MPTIRIRYPATPYTNEAANKTLAALGGSQFARRDEDRAHLVRGSIVLGTRMAWGEATPTALTVTYSGRLPKGVVLDLAELVERGIISGWEKEGT